MSKKSSDIKKRAQKIKLLIMDVDGVLTPGYIMMGESGRETKIFDVYDGFGIMLWRKSGLKSAIITAGLTGAVEKRAGCLKVDCVYQNAKDKLHVYERLKKRLNVKDDEICFIGDDLIDIPILKKAGLACCVANACPEVSRYVHYKSVKEGGRGAVREIIEMVLKSKGIWKDAIREYIR